MDWVQHIEKDTESVISVNTTTNTSPNLLQVEPTEHTPELSDRPETPETGDEEEKVDRRVKLEAKTDDAKEPRKGKAESEEEYDPAEDVRKSFHLMPKLLQKEIINSP